MTYVGQVQNGQVVFPNPLPLADGTRVCVEKLDEPMLTAFGTRDPNWTTEEILKDFKEFQSRNSLGGLKLRDLIEEGRP
jgi:hypothetical protein